MSAKILRFPLERVTGWAPVSSYASRPMPEEIGQVSYGNVWTPPRLSPRDRELGRKLVEARQQMPPRPDYRKAMQEYEEFLDEMFGPEALKDK